MLDHKRLHKSFYFAFEGIVFAIKESQNLRIAFLMGGCSLLFGILFHIPSFQLGLVGVMSLLLISVEMINTAIEEMVNLIINEHRKEAKIAKDVSAGMVLFVLIGSVIVDIVVFLPYVATILFEKLLY